jgi:hypothetical protein
MDRLANDLWLGCLARLAGTVVLAVQSFYSSVGLLGQLACVAQLSGADGTSGLPVSTVWSGTGSRVAWPTGTDALDFWPSWRFVVALLAGPTEPASWVGSMTRLSQLAATAG